LGASASALAQPQRVDSWKNAGLTDQLRRNCAIPRKPDPAERAGPAHRALTSIAFFARYRAAAIFALPAKTFPQEVFMKKNGSAEWKGSLKDGGGTISTETGVLKNAPYGFKSRFEDGPGTNPEELLGAAHAACFSMALSLMLGQNNLKPDYIRTKAEISLEKVGEGFAITASQLTVNAKIPGADTATFERIANEAKAGCPVSKVLNAKITMQATLDA
jgi:osmotically inducible protein OsmC